MSIEEEQEKINQALEYLDNDFSDDYMQDTIDKINLLNTGNDEYEIENLSLYKNNSNLLKESDYGVLNNANDKPIENDLISATFGEKEYAMYFDENIEKEVLAEREENLKKEEQLRKALEESPQNIQDIIDTMKKAKQTRKEIYENIEIKNEVINQQTPKQALLYAESTFKNINSNDQIKEMVDTANEIKNIEQELNQLKNPNNKENSQQNNQKENEMTNNNSNDSFDNTFNPITNDNLANVDLEDYTNNKIKNLEERLEEARNKLDNHINALVESKDFIDLLKALYAIDTSVALMKRESLELTKEKEQEKARRLNELLEQQVPEALKQFAKESIFELSQKLTEGEEIYKQAQVEKDTYYKIVKIFELGEEHNDFKLQELNKITEKLKINAPNFNQKYPIISKKVGNFFEKMEKKQEKENNLTHTR